MIPLYNNIILLLPWHIIILGFHCIAHRVKTQSSGKTRQPIMDFVDWPKA